MTIRKKLKAKIKTDTGFDIPDNAVFHRHSNLSWQQLTAGRLIWYWRIPADGSRLANEYTIGSSEKMTDLLKCPCIKLHKHAGQTELFSS